MAANREFEGALVYFLVEASPGEQSQISKLTKQYLSSGELPKLALLKAVEEVTDDR